MMSGSMPMSSLMMDIGCKGTPMILATPVATPTPVVGRLPHTGIKGGGGRHIEGGEGVGGGGVNDRPGLLMFKVPYLRARQTGTGKRARGI